MNDLISRQAAIDALHMHLMYRMGTDSNKKRLDDWINGVPSAQPRLPRWAQKVEKYHEQALKMPYIKKPFAWALYQVWKEYDNEETERRTDGTEDTD